MFCGHSLGAALTELAALRATKEGLVSANGTQVYTIGAPRAGDAAFAAEYNSALPNTWRMVNRSDGLFDLQDVITQIPPKALGYRQVGNLAQLTGDKIALLPRSSAPAQMLELTRGVQQTDPADPENAQVEALSGEALAAFLRSVSTQNLERHDAAPKANPMVLELALPSARLHASGEYLRRTGVALLES
jgi:hypothetical protein